MPRVIVCFLLALCLSACSLLSTEPEPPATQPGGEAADTPSLATEPTEPKPTPIQIASLMLQGRGLALPGLDDPEAQRQSAFTAALVDALGQGVPVDTEVMDLGGMDKGLRILTGRGRFQGFTLLRQQVLLGGEPLSELTVAERDDHVLVVRMGRMERMDPALAPLFPAHGQASEFVGLPLSKVEFGQQDGLVSCTVRLGGVPATDLPKEQGFDSLVVDARYCAIGPTRLVRLLGPGGKELYGPNNLPGSLLVEHGVAKFTTSYEKAQVLLEAQGASNPLTVRCVSVTRTGENQEEALVLSAQGAEALAKADAQSGFLKLGRVVILTAP